MIVKRMIDFTLSIVAMVVFFPLLIIVSILVYIRLGSPVFFTQDRVGKNGRIFKMIKFRSMRNSKDKNGELLADGKRLTRLGRVIRSTSIDELPELINIIKGDMSLVGPRPLLVEYITRYSKRQFRRHEVLPGLTGWAQINGRNIISWEKKFELDVWYVENWSILLDIKIIIMTVSKVFKKADINQDDNITMEEFMGDKHGGE
ncbi:sugar transferase [Clostridium sp.]|uniref:sugar transferase n=1 Tax=Clostridium sp. TaxID=1506 RepID=UPI003D6CFC51